MSRFCPDFSKYDVVIVDYEGDLWGEKTQRDFVRFVENGGGVVIYHAADNAFPNWAEFNEIMGVGGWAGRDAHSGPMVRWRNGAAVLDENFGEATHPPPYDFVVTNRAPEHPIMRGLPLEWLHANDEMYSRLHGPAKNLTVLATACADPAEVEGGTGENEPMLMTVAFGKGRAFHTTLGHVGMKDVQPVTSLNCVGFVTTFLRGLEWAATGEVSQVVPEDFPSSDRVSVGSEY